MNALEICQMRAAGAQQKAAEATAKRNHSMPKCAAMLAQAREEYGAKAEIAWAIEGEKKWGNPDWWKRNGCVYDHEPDNRTVKLSDMDLKGVS